MNGAGKVSFSRLGLQGLKPAKGNNKRATFGATWIVAMQNFHRCHDAGQDEAAQQHCRGRCKSISFITCESAEGLPLLSIGLVACMDSTARCSLARHSVFDPAWSFWYRVAVKELNLSHYTGETLLYHYFSIYIYTCICIPIMAT